MKKFFLFLKTVCKINKRQRAIDKKQNFRIIFAAIFEKSKIFCGIFFPAFIIDIIVNNENYNKVLGVVLLFSVVITTFDFMSNILRELISVNSEKTSNLIRMDLCKKNFSLKYADTQSAEYVEQEDKATDAYIEMDDTDWVIIHGIFGPLISIVTLSYVFIELDIIVLVVIILVIILNYIITELAIKKDYHYDTVINKLDRQKDDIEDLLLNIKIGKEFRIYNSRKFIVNKFTKIANEILSIDYNKKKYNVGINCIKTLLQCIETIVIYVFAILKYSHGLISIGSFTIYIKATRELSSSLIDMFESIAWLSKSTIYYKDFEEFMNIPEADEIKDPKQLNYSMPPKIEFKNVSFKYPKQTKYALTNISFSIEPNQKVSVVGDNGSGKSTMIKLLMRLYDVSDGEILVNDINIKQYDYKDYVKLFSPVFQDYELFEYTIKENIIFDTEYEEEKLDESIKKAGLGEKIDSLKNGVDTIMGMEMSSKGVDFSGGEKQKLAFARAFYKDTPAMVLDEPTSAMDVLSEFELFNNINNEIKNKTAIYISHRLTSSRFSDVVLVLDEAELVQNGKHDDLIKIEGLYKEMYTKQAFYYKD